MFLLPIQFVIPGLLLLAIIVPLFFIRYERRMIYRNDRSDYANRRLDQLESETLRGHVQIIDFPATDGTRLNAWYVAAPAGRPTILFAHGNWGNVGWRGGVIQNFVEHEYGIFVFDYRGYGLSQGKPSEKGLYKDIDGASNYLAAHGVPIADQVAIGESLGSGVVVDSATRRPYKAVVTIAGYSSLRDVGKSFRQARRLGILNYFPVEKLMTQAFDSERKIAKVQTPVLIVHGAQDTYIPPALSEKLFQKVTSPYKHLLMIQGATHETVLYEGSAQILSALDDLLQCSTFFSQTP